MPNTGVVQVLPGKGLGGFLAALKNSGVTSEDDLARALDVEVSVVNSLLAGAQACSDGAVMDRLVMAAANKKVLTDLAKDEITPVTMMAENIVRGRYKLGLKAVQESRLVAEEKRKESEAKAKEAEDRFVNAKVVTP